MTNSGIDTTGHIFSEIYIDCGDIGGKVTTDVSDAVGQFASGVSYINDALWSANILAICQKKLKRSERFTGAPGKDVSWKKSRDTVPLILV